MDYEHYNILKELDGSESKSACNIYPRTWLKYLEPNGEMIEMISKIFLWPIDAHTHKLTHTQTHTHRQTHIHVNSTSYAQKQQWILFKRQAFQIHGLN